jgi:hypothetical protein
MGYLLDAPQGMVKRLLYPCVRFSIEIPLQGSTTPAAASYATGPIDQPKTPLPPIGARLLAI